MASYCFNGFLSFSYFLSAFFFVSCDSHLDISADPVTRTPYSNAVFRLAAVPRWAATPYSGQGCEREKERDRAEVCVPLFPSTLTNPLKSYRTPLVNPPRGDALSSFSFISSWHPCFPCNCVVICLQSGQHWLRSVALFVKPCRTRYPLSIRRLWLLRTPVFAAAVPSFIRRVLRFVVRNFIVQPGFRHIFLGPRFVVSNPLRCPSSFSFCFFSQCQNQEHCCEPGPSTRDRRCPCPEFFSSPASQYEVSAKDIKVFSLVKDEFAVNFLGCN